MHCSSRVPRANTNHSLGRCPKSSWNSLRCQDKETSKDIFFKVGAEGRGQKPQNLKADQEAGVSQMGAAIQNTAAPLSTGYLACREVG